MAKHILHAFKIRILRMFRIHIEKKPSSNIILIIPPNVLNLNFTKVKIHFDFKKLRINEKRAHSCINLKSFIRRHDKTVKSI